MNNLPIKATSREFTKEPFFLIQSNGTEKRYVVSLRNKIRIKILLSGFINQSKNEIQIKIRDFESYDKPIDYIGSLSKIKLHELMTKHEETIFHNGNHVLMLKNSESGDFIVFDEHGLIFIYTNQDYTDILIKLGAKYSPKQKLIYEFNHWHFCIEESEKKLKEMIKDFELEIEE